MFDWDSEVIFFADSRQRKKISLNMGLLCDFCGKERAMVHCKSDAACLCLPCDRRVHAANDLAKQHWRRLLCDKCNSQPAVTWYVDEKISFCEICDLNGLDEEINTRNQQKINGYSECPSSPVFSKIWSLAPDFPSSKSFHDQGRASEASEYNRSTTADLLTDTFRIDDSEDVNAWIGSSSKSAVTTLECNPDGTVGSEDSPAQNMQVIMQHNQF